MSVDVSDQNQILQQSSGAFQQSRSNDEAVILEQQMAQQPKAQRPSEAAIRELLLSSNKDSKRGQKRTAECLDDFPPHLVCPITGQPFKDPVITPDAGQTCKHPP